MNAITRRRALMNVDTGPKEVIVTRNYSVTTAAGTKDYTIWTFNLVVGTTYTFDWETTGRSGDSVKITVQSNGSTDYTYADSGSFTKTISVTPNPMRVLVRINNPKAGTFKLNISYTTYV